MPTNVNGIREMATRTSGGQGLTHTKKLVDQLEYSDDCRVAAHFARMAVSSIWMDDTSLVKLASVARKLLKVVRLVRSQDVARKAA